MNKKPEIRKSTRNPLNWVVDFAGPGRPYINVLGVPQPQYCDHPTKVQAQEALDLYLSKQESPGGEEVDNSIGCGKCKYFRGNLTSCGKNWNTSSENFRGCQDFKPSNPKQFGHPRFYEILEQMKDLHSRKNHDYAGTSDPLKNLRACTQLELEPFIGVMVRLQDKWSRLEEFVKSGKLMVKGESVKDTLMDNAVYSVLAIILYEEQEKAEKESSNRTKPVPGGY